MPKMGRPIIGDKKDIDIKVRIDSKTHEDLLKYCEENETNKAQAIRLAIKKFLKK